MESSSADISTPRKWQQKRGTVAAIVGLQVLTAGAFGIMSPILSIVMTEVLIVVNCCHYVGYIRILF